MTQSAGYSPAFLKIRQVAFGLLCLLALCWIVFYSVALFLLWDVLEAQRLIMLAMIISNTFSIIMFPILAILSFRPYLDGARSICVFTLDVGLAVLFASKFANGQQRCLELGTSINETNSCRVIAEVTVGISWINPIALFIYFVGLVYAVRSKRIYTEDAFSAYSETQSTIFSPFSPTIPTMSPITPLDSVFPRASLGHHYSQKSRYSVPPGRHSSHHQSWHSQHPQAQLPYRESYQSHAVRQTVGRSPHDSWATTASKRQSNFTHTPSNSYGSNKHLKHVSGQLYY
ncbi:hypothetical protein DL96DRAFT_1578577 [Flagelloscypha sp. PMI_526]|nr:hypothetical protein DL96DRAFT_1578577 [Flagelloscypha sp. PMI_526]